MKVLGWFLSICWFFGSLNILAEIIDGTGDTAGNLIAVVLCIGQLYFNVRAVSEQQ